MVQFETFRALASMIVIAMLRQSFLRPANPRFTTAISCSLTSPQPANIILRKFLSKLTPFLL